MGKKRRVDLFAPLVDYPPQSADKLLSVRARPHGNGTDRRGKARYLAVASVAAKGDAASATHVGKNKGVKPPCRHADHTREGKQPRKQPFVLGGKPHPESAGGDQTVAHWRVLGAVKGKK